MKSTLQGKLGARSTILLRRDTCRVGNATDIQKNDAAGEKRSRGEKSDALPENGRVKLEIGWGAP